MKKISKLILMFFLITSGIISVLSLTSCGTKNDQTETEETPVLKEETTLYCNLTQTTFTFNYGVTKNQISNTIRDSLSTNATTVYVLNSNTNVGTYTVTIEAYLKSEKIIKNATVIIRAVEEKLQFLMTKDSFEFDYGTTVNEIKTEIAKHITTNGTVSYSTIDVTKTGTQFVFVAASKGTESISQSIYITILTEEEKLKFSMTKESFEFDYGTTVDEMKTEIAKYITTNGEVNYLKLSDEFAVGSHTARIFVTKNSSSAYKDITIIISDKGVLKLSKEDFEFSYGITYKEIKDEISKYIITNCEISFPDIDDNNVLACQSYYMNLTGKYKGESITYKMYFDIVPDDSNVKVTGLADITTLSTQQTYTISITNNSGKAIDSMIVSVYLYVDGIVRSCSALSFDPTDDLANGETRIFNVRITYKSEFAPFSIDEVGTHNAGYDYNFCKSYTGKYYYRYNFNNIVYA